MATLGRRKNRVELLIRSLVGMLLAGLVFQVIAGPGASGGNFFSNGVMLVASPFLRAGAAAHRGMESVWTGVFSADALRAENAALREQVASLHVENPARRATEALAYLTQEISTAIPAGTFELMPVPVLSLAPARGRQVAWIDAGREQGLSPGMIVLGAHGIVGEVDEVFATTALVELVTDSRAAWGAEVDGRGEIGVLSGTGDPELVEMRFERTSQRAEPGDIVVSSGMAGSIAPGGVPFGVIEKIATNKQGEAVAIVRLSEKPGSLRTLFVLPHARIPFEPKR